MTKYLTNEQLNEMLTPAEDFCPIGSQWRHNKSAGQYTVEGIALSEGGQEPVVIYRANVKGAVAWARVAQDFMDGRFVRIENIDGTKD
jgi:hypothetical protein